MSLWSLSSNTRDTVVSYHPGDNAAPGCQSHQEYSLALEFTHHHKLCQKSFTLHGDSDKYGRIRVDVEINPPRRLLRRVSSKSKQNAG
jgi:hypothetical protein